MVAAECPTSEMLRDYALGRLTEHDWEEIAAHVESCPQCQAAMATIDDAADTLVAQLRGPAAADSFVKESQCGAALKRARGITGASGAARSADLPFKELGEYQVLEELGQGGMGAVYKARHTKLDRVVAIKVLTRGRSGDRRAIARFEREMKAVGRFDHPQIVRAHDAREIGGAPVLIMEYVEGFDLGRLVRRLGPLPMAEACELVRQAAVGLQYVHEQGLVHRDLKPSNLMLTPEAAVKILDLGLARFHFEHAEGEVTNSGQAMGTADYMAPEQASDSHAVDIRADIYSLGCTFYKLLTGRAPFEREPYRGTFEKMTAHVQHSVPPIQGLLPQVPAALAAILQRMLAKDPADRYAEPAEVVEALAPFCEGAKLPALLTQAAERESSFSQPLQIRSPQPSVGGSLRPTGLPLRRRTLAALVLGLLLIGGGFSFALGILITIKRDGTTTTIEAPEASKIQVDGQGKIAIDSGTAEGEAMQGGLESYQIGGHDVLCVRVTGAGPEQCIDGDFETDSRGIVGFPNVGPVNFKGLTLDEATQAIEKSFQKVYQSPQVTLTLDRRTIERRIRYTGGRKPPKLRQAAPSQTVWWTGRSEPKPPPQPHRIATGDRLDIAIQVNAKTTPDLGRWRIQQYIVDSDGRLQLLTSLKTEKHLQLLATQKEEELLPALKEINFKGLTEQQARDSVKAKFPDVEFNLTIMQFKPTPVWWSARNDQEMVSPDSHAIDFTSGTGWTAIPPDPYTIGFGDSLLIRTIGTLLDSPIDGVYLVEPTGTLALGPAYGRVHVQGLSLVEAEKAIEKSLRNILTSPQVSVTLAGWKDRSEPEPPPQPHRIDPGDILDIRAAGTLLDQPIRGPYLVESDGQVTLGPAYGRVNLKGLTFQEAQKVVRRKLSEILRKPEVSITLWGWRKEWKPPSRSAPPRPPMKAKRKATPKKGIPTGAMEQPQPPSSPWWKKDLPNIPKPGPPLEAIEK